MYALTHSCYTTQLRHKWWQVAPILYLPGSNGRAKTQIIQSAAEHLKTPTYRGQHFPYYTKAEETLAVVTMEASK